MNGEEIFARIILIGCCWLCGAVFAGIGYWSSVRKDPMHFYTGTTVDPGSVSDIPAYNRANARMWYWYSVPFWLAGIAAFFNTIVSVVIMSLACIPGFLFLIHRYRKICDKYMIR